MAILVIDIMYGLEPQLSCIFRRIYRRGYTDFTPKEIFALGSLPFWGYCKFYLIARSLPGVTRNPPFSPILDSTG